MLELSMYLTNKFGELPECLICQDYATISSEFCSNENCSTVLHCFCRSEYFGQGVEEKCPSCTVPWISGVKNKQKLFNPVVEEDNSEDVMHSDQSQLAGSQDDVLPATQQEATQVLESDEEPTQAKRKRSSTSKENS